ncbi:hypothetical protein EB796_008954 [Bugula neritina]|uniref:G-protein coupled receptors family 1 profile domain-containing protein n=1 Tax=Bugula neritina TaxID=10212 RepID=A0A7J7K576_BUGNE|nr:hypothetical protein EB796_008954 [Bugula neritina]
MAAFQSHRFELKKTIFRAEIQSYFNMSSTDFLDYSNVTETTPRPPNLPTKYLWACGGALILLIGTVGHILAIAVTLISRNMKAQSSSVYIIAMSVTGIITLYSGLIRYMIFIGFSNWDNDIRESSDTFCKIHMVTTYVAIQYFAWLQATVAVDRLISVKWPYVYMKNGKWKVALIAIVVELFIVTCINIPLAMHTHQNERGYCVAEVKFYENIWGYIDLASYSLVPMFVMVLCNSFILYLLSKSKFRTGNNNSALARSLTIMLMSLNVLFVITTLPVSVVFFLDWGEFLSKRYLAIEVYWSAFSLMQYAGCAGTFFVYCVTGSKFREELRELYKRCCPCKAKKKSIANQTNTKNTSPALQSCSADYKALKVSVDNEELSMSTCV